MPQAESHGGQIYPQPARSAHRCSSPFHTATSPSATGAKRACPKFITRSRSVAEKPRAYRLSTLLLPEDNEEALAMLGRQSDPDGGDHPYLDHVGRDSFYGFLALHRKELFCEEDFADLYCLDNGRPSVPPSLLATALLLQAYESISDEEAKARADFDLRWKVALGVGLGERPFAKSTLQLFRARLIIHERVRTVFQKSLDFARHTGYH